jgi:hypothetical protein
MEHFAAECVHVVGVVGIADLLAGRNPAIEAPACRHSMKGQ